MGGVVNREETHEEWRQRWQGYPDTITPENNPDHHTVGRKFRAWDGREYECTWYNASVGYQMESTDDAEKGCPHRSTNVSERAVGNTFRLI